MSLESEGDGETETHGARSRSGGKGSAAHREECRGPYRNREPPTICPCEAILRSADFIKELRAIIPHDLWRDLTFAARIEEVSVTVLYEAASSSRSIARWVRSPQVPLRCLPPRSQRGSKDSAAPLVRHCARPCGWNGGGLRDDGARGLYSSIVIRWTRGCSTRTCQKNQSNA